MPSSATVRTPDGDMVIYDPPVEGEPRGAVVVIQEAFGVNDHIEDVTRRFTAAGYRAVAPHLFHRTGDPVVDYGDYAKLMPHFEALSEAGILHDLDATAAYLGEAGFAQARTGVVGFCMGGTVAFLAAVRRPIGAAVTFYGGGVAEGRFGMAPLVELAPDLQAPWLGLYGDLDQSIRVEDVEALRAAAVRARCPPRWCATGMPVTGSTATCGPTSTRWRPPTRGAEPSNGSSAICPTETGTDA